MKKPSLLRRFLATKGIHYIATRFGPSRVRGLAFDGKYQNGEWNFNGDGGELPELVRRYLRNGDLLVMGCGSATVLESFQGNELNSALGVDLSEEAIRLAGRFATARVSFQVADMEKFLCPRTYDVILFSESIYYVANTRQLTLLSRLAESLKPGGVFVVTFAQVKRYEDILERIRTNFRILEDRAFSGSSRHLIVFGKT